MSRASCDAMRLPPTPLQFTRPPSLLLPTTHPYPLRYKSTLSRWTNFSREKGGTNTSRTLRPVSSLPRAALPQGQNQEYETRLREYTAEYFQQIVKAIKRHTSQGLMRKMAQVSNLNTQDEFRTLEAATTIEYSREIVRLLFNCMEQAHAKPDEPYYLLTDEQEDNLLSLREILFHPQCDPFLAAPLLHRAVFSLLTEEKEKGNISWFDMTVISFLVARCMGESEFIRSSEIGRVVAKLIWGVRGTVLFQMELDMDNESLKTAEAYARYKKFLTDGEDTVFAYLFNMSVLLKSIRGEEYVEANVHFTDDGGRELSYKGSTVSLDDFAVLHDALTDEYDTIIARDIFFGEPIPEWFSRDIDIRSLVDDPRNVTAGYSFIDDPRNPFSDLADLYGEWLLSSPERAAQFVSIIDGQIVWKSAPCFRLLRACARARRFLITLKIIGVGPSIRATEISRDLLRNVSGAGVRNLMILYHTLVIVGIQDKTSHKILKKRFTPGAPPLATSLRLIRNLVYLRRFESDLIRFFRGDQEAERYNMYLWPDVRSNISGDVISADLGEATSLYLHLETKILLYRSIVTAFMRYNFGVQHDLEREEMYDALSHHSTTTSNQHYGLDRASLANAPIKHVEGCIATTIKWQALIGVDKPEPLRLHIGATAHKGVVLLPDVAEHLNNGDASGVERIEVHRGDVITKTNLAENMESLFVKLSAAYFPKPPPPPLPGALPPTTSVLVHPSRLAALRKFLNDPKATFRSPKQGEIVEKMIARQRHILAVVPCDFGKTFLGMFVAQMFDKHLVTVWIQPLTGLGEDFKDRAASFGIRVHKYKNSWSVDPSATMVYVSVELAVNDDFLQFLSDLIETRRLARIVFDEFHLLVLAFHYREPMRRICDAFKASTHISLFSGTFPPHLLLDLMEITGIYDWEEIRMPTENPNIAYGVTVLPKEKYIDGAVKYVSDRVKTYRNPADKAMVFCCTCDETDYVAALLNVPPYHSKVDVDDRAATYSAWAKGATKIMVSTTILAEGVNLPVRDVVCIGHAHNALSKKQMTARTARNKTKGRAVFFVPADSEPIRANPSKPFGGEYLIQWAYDKTECRRIKDSLFLDGFAVNCISLEGAELCDNCDRAIRHDIPAPPLPVPTPVARAPAHSDDTASAPRRSAIVQNAPPLERYDGRREGRGGNPAVVSAGGRSTTSAPAMGQRHATGRTVARQNDSSVHGKRSALPPQMGRSRLANAAEPDEDEAEIFGISHVERRPTSSQGPPSPPAPESARYDPWGDDDVSSSTRVMDFSTMTMSVSQSPSRRFPANTSGANGSSEAMRDPSSRSGAVASSSHGPGRQFAPPAEENAVASSSKTTLDSTAPSALGRARRALAAATNRAPPAGLAIQINSASIRQAEDAQLKLMKKLKKAMERLRDGCAACWARGLADWDAHDRNGCPKSIEDNFYHRWHKSAMKGAEGVCWQCGIPRKAGHEWVEDVAVCRDEYIIHAALYAFCTDPGDDLWLGDYDATLDFKDFGAFWSWATGVVVLKTQRLHQVFAWMVDQRQLL
ncbi:C2H2-type domain-containing protein [Mycena sanguinolenta]|uniref:DNA 3'-5' helicase n=1 Tax=Mycena sanguinolenta TaxID=230812 RepID=A0A8H6U1T8_9AGAR|nr:C2H2-type domain-containing protein [Mycena sanguinolenta]